MKAVTNGVAMIRPRAETLRNAIAEALLPASSKRSSHARGGDLVVAATSGAAILSAVFAVAATTPALAQEEAGSRLEEITVTGSRIRRQDFTANAPITTVDETAFEDTGTIGVETILNQLPQFVPAITHATRSARTRGGRPLRPSTAATIRKAAASRTKRSAIRPAVFPAE